MGWSSGAGVLAILWEKVRNNIPEEKRVEVLVEYIKEFEDRDADTICELQYYHKDWPELEQALRKTDNWYDEDE